MLVVFIRYNIIFMIMMVLVLVMIVSNDHNVVGTRVYHNQFPKGSDHIPMPNLVLFSIYMGEIHYSYLPLTLASMKWNANVKFVIINVYNPEKSLENWKKMLEQHPVPNLHVEYITIQQFSDIVNDKLKVRIPFDDTWYYKLCDFKPTLAYLFPHLAGTDTFKYWGYADLDVIWGNITRWSYLFNENRPFLISGWFHTTGALNMFINEDWTRSLFLSDPRYVPLLTEKTYHNLDEMGTQIAASNVVDDGAHAMYNLEQVCPKCKEYTAAGHPIFNRGRVPQETLFIGGSEFDWSGHTIWSRGRLTIPSGSPEFPPGRELMFYHVRSEQKLKFDDQVHESLVQDMVKYGFVLPSLIPLFSRFACHRGFHEGLHSMDDIYSFYPYDPSCFGKKPHADKL